MFIIIFFLCCFLTTERVYYKIREISTFLEVLEFHSILCVCAHKHLPMCRGTTFLHIHHSPPPQSTHRRLCKVKNMLAMYLKYHKAELTPTTPVTSIAISPVKMSIGRKSLTNLRSGMIFLQGKPVFYIFLPSTPPY